MTQMFQVGDYVAACGNHYGITNEANGWCGVVEKVSDDMIVVIGRGIGDSEDCKFTVQAKHFRLARRETVEPPETDPFSGLF